MNAKRNDGSLLQQGRRPPFWKNSTYEEPVWVSLTWILVPVLIAGLTIYMVIT